MYLTGFADEAAPDLATQIKATKEIGWNAISARSVNGASIHELSDKEFNKVANELDKAEIRVPEIGSLIGNWGKKIDSDFDITLGEITQLKPGDLIQLSATPKSPVKLEANQQALFWCQLGQADGVYKLRVEDVFDPEQEFIGDLLNS